MSRGADSEIDKINDTCDANKDKILQNRTKFMKAVDENIKTEYDQSFDSCNKNEDRVKKMKLLLHEEKLKCQNFCRLLQKKQNNLDADNKNLEKINKSLKQVNSALEQKCDKLKRDARTHNRSLMSKDRELNDMKKKKDGEINELKENKKVLDNYISSAAETLSRKRSGLFSGGKKNKKTKRKLRKRRSRSYKR